jgi:outer membrane protein OmpA-like peptidoglycan-associated protein
MGATLIDTTREMFTPEMTAKAAAATGEPPDNIHQAMLGAVPTIFAGLAEHASKPGSTPGILSMLKEGLGGDSGGEVARGGRELAERGQALVGNIFGDRKERVSSALAVSSGVSSSSASLILSFAGPLVAGVLGKEVMTRGLNASTLTQLIASHKNAVVEDPYTPPGLADAMGTARRPEGERAVAEEVPTTGAEARQKPREVKEGNHGAVRRTRWGSIFGGVLALAALAVWGIFAIARDNASRPGVTEMQPQTPPMGPSAQPRGGAEAPGGQAPVAPQNSPESDLEQAVNDESIPLPYTARLDQLAFDPGSGILRPEASSPLGTVAAILEAHPSARVRVEGHADRPGDTTANRALAESRAEAVKIALQDRGVSSERIEVEWRGLSAGRDTEKAQAFGRRAEIVVLSR